MSDTNLQLKYFWQERGNLERWVGWQTAKDIPPEVLKAHADYVTARNILDAVIEALPIPDCVEP